MERRRIVKVARERKKQMKENKPECLARNPPDETNKKEWINHNTCRFCVGSRLHTCTGYDCRGAIEKAERRFEKDRQQAINANVAAGSNDKGQQEGKDWTRKY